MVNELQDMLRERYEKSWKGRAERHTKGNETQLGAMVIAMLGRRPLRPPMFTGLAIIDRTGLVRCDFTDKNGHELKMLPIGDVLKIVTDFKNLADALKVTDSERTEMFTELRKWIMRDARAKSDENTF